ncbi:hypothetical protein ACWA7J_07960 [Leptothrix sp. BB-4]
MRFRPFPTRRTAARLACALTLGVGSAAAEPVNLSNQVAAPACTATPGAPAIAGWQALAPDLWLLPGAAGDTDAGNRGAISNLLLLFDGPRTWLVGAGPSAAYGRALSADIRCRFGRTLTDAIAPWPRPELVLGLAGLDASVRLWAHADVAAAMAERCAHCSERLQARLGEHAADLGEPPSIPRPQRLLDGEQGRLGPWHWWRVERTPGTAVTLWSHAPSGIVSAHGLSWSDGAPDLRDATLDGIEAGTAQLQQIASALSSATPRRPPRWLPEQGPVDRLATPDAQAAYWQALREAVSAAQSAGIGETEPAPAQLPGVDARFTRSERHALNWQRAWRELEDRAFDAAPASRPEGR